MVLTATTTRSKRPALLDLERLDRPVLFRVVHDGPVRAELAHLGASSDALLQPCALVQVRFVDQLESVDIRLEVFREEVVIVITDSVQQPRRRRRNSLSTAVEPKEMVKGTYGS